MKTITFTEEELKYIFYLLNVKYIENTHLIYTNMSDDIKAVESIVNDQRLLEDIVNKMGEM